MPRIRTIKPEFWADEKLATMPRDARLLFIGLFNFADDSGRLRGNPLLIRAQVFPYDSDVDPENLLRVLAEHSLIVRYEVRGEAYVWVRNFTKHQKIDRPSDSALPPPPAETRSAKPQRTIGEASSLEGKGKEGNGSGKGVLLPAPAAPAETADVWGSYSSAYELRHGVRPPDSAKGRSQLKQFLTRVPRSDGPSIAAFFLTHNDAEYVRKKHPIDLLLTHAPKLYAEWKTGSRVTGTEALQADKTQANAEGWLKHMSPEGRDALAKQRT